MLTVYMFNIRYYKHTSDAVVKLLYSYITCTMDNGKCKIMSRVQNLRTKDTYYCKIVNVCWGANFSRLHG